MRQADLNRAVARATGESVSTITRLGFLLDAPLAQYDELDTEAYGAELCDTEVCDAMVIDWDTLEAQRYAETNGRPRRDPAMS